MNVEEHPTFYLFKSFFLQLLIAPLPLQGCIRGRRLSKVPSSRRGPHVILGHTATPPMAGIHSESVKASQGRASQGQSRRTFKCSAILSVVSSARRPRRSPLKRSKLGCPPMSLRSSRFGRPMKLPIDFQLSFQSSSCPHIKLPEFWRRALFPNINAHHRAACVQ